MRVVMAGVACVLLLAAPALSDGVVHPKPPTRAGLWLMEKHTNLAVFVAPAATASEAAKRSDEALAAPGMRLQACLTPEEQAKHLDLASSGIGCTIGAPQLAGDTVTVDSVCHERKIHTVYRLNPERLIASMTSTMTGGPSTQKSIVRFDSPEHITMEVTMSGLSGPIPVIDRWDFRWLSADCQGLAPGQFKPLTDKPETRR